MKPSPATCSESLDPLDSEGFYRGLFDAAGDAIIACTEDGRAIDCNAAALALHRCAREQLLGSTPADWSPEFQPDGRRSDEAAAAIFARALAGETVSFEWQSLRADGDRIDVSVTVRLTQTEGRRVVVVISRDVTEQKRAQALLRERDAVFREVAENIGEVFWVVSPDWRTVKYISPAYERIWGRPAAGLYANGMEWLESVVEIYRPALLEKIPVTDSLEECEMVAFPEYEIRRPDGTLRWISARAYPVRDEKGEVVNFAGIAEDVTARRHAEDALRRNQALLNATGEMACVGGWEIDLETGHLTWTEQVYRIHEVGPDYHPTVETAIAFYTPESRPVIEAAVQRAIQHGDPFDVELEIITAKSNQRGVHAVGRVHREGGVAETVRGAIQDITERKRADAALRDSEMRYRSLADNSLDWVWTIDLQGRHTYSNRSCARILGYAPEEFIQIAALDLVHPDDVPLFRCTFVQAISQRRGWSNVVLRWRARDGMYRQLESSASPLFDAQGRLCGFQGMDRDVTERMRQEETMWQQANFDALTGLANRNLLHDRLELALAQGRRDDRKVGLLFLDLDGFKWINDMLGHSVGDELLIEVARRLRTCVRGQDTVARLGGDEFTLVIPNLTSADALQSIAEKTVGVLREPYKLAGGQYRVSGSVGITLFPEDAQDVEALLRCADIAMYQCKQAGKNHFQFYAPHMQAHAQARMRVEADLRIAIDERAFVLHYQPIVSARGGELVGVEALLRWRHPARGLLEAADFIRVAEDSGLIVTIGEWVLREAAGQWRRWQGNGHPPLQLAVNISGVEFRQADLTTLLAGIVQEHGMDRRQLIIEIAEPVLTGDTDTIEATMRKLTALDLGYAIDDFGTGACSLSCITRLPVDVIKIDRKFIMGCATDRGDARLVEAVINTAHSLDLRVTAEGVENAEQLGFLRDLGVDYLQGSLISGPLPASDFEGLFGRGPLLGKNS